MNRTEPLTSRFIAWILAACFGSSTLVAIDVSEGPDFPNAAAGTPYTLGAGVNAFSGTVNTSTGDSQDRFDVTVPAGMRITAVAKNVIATGGPAFSGGVVFNGEGLAGTGSANFVGIPNPFPLAPGTYSALVNANVSPGNSWTVTITVIVVPDYAVTTTGGVLTVTDSNGNGDLLDVLQPSAGAIRFAAAGRSFSVNGGAAITDTSGNLSLAGVTSVVVNSAAGDDTVRVGAFSGTFPSLTVNGGTGDDTVRFEGDISFATDRNLDVDLQNDAASPGVDAVNVAAGANLVTNGAGTIVMKCSRNVSLSAGASLETGSGALTVEANQQSVPTSGNFIGVSLDGTGTLIRKRSAFGDVIVAGRGGDDAGGGQHGVSVTDGATIAASTSTIGGVYVTGRGGASPGIANYGVNVSGNGSSISATTDVFVNGTAGSLGASRGIGVSVRSGGEIATPTIGVTSITGAGAGAAGSGSNHGVEVDGASSRLGSGFYGVIVAATAGPGTPTGESRSWGLALTNSAQIVSGFFGGIGIIADTASLAPTASINSGAPVQFTSANSMDLGGADAPGVLGLTDAELDRVSTPHLRFSSEGSGAITISSPITRSASTDVTFSGSTTQLRPVATGTDLEVGGTVTLATALAIPITGVQADTGYPQLRIFGRLAFTQEPLNLAGTILPGAVGDIFTIIDNDGVDIGSAQFAALPEGAIFPWPGSPSLRGRISYVGGDGNDVTLALIGGIEVTNLNNAGPGSLRAALATAAGNPGSDIISFHPGLIFRVESVTTLSNSELSVRYSRSVGAGATARENYAINGVPWTVFTPLLATNQRVVTLPLTAPLSPGATYTLSIANVSASNADLLAPNPTHVTFSGAVGAIQTTAAPALRIPLSSEIAVNDGSGPVTIDASGIPGGVILDAVTSSRHFRIASGTTLHLSNLTITGGVGSGATVTGFGGAILNEGGALALADCTLSSNSASALSSVFRGDGGAIYNDGGTVTLTRCTLSGNHAYSGGEAFAGNGGAIYNGGGILTLTQCTLSGNSASGDGGAICNDNIGGALVLTHCTVSANSATFGGGIFNALSPFTLRNSIIADNAALASGDEVYNNTATLTFEGANIVPQNIHPTVGPDPILDPPRLAPLGDYGGPTRTMALLSGSPARDAALGSIATADQRGFPIIGTPDIGAYEAGTIANYTHWAWETLPASATAAERAAAFDLDLDARNHAMEFATFTDGGEPTGGQLFGTTRNRAGTQATLVVPYRGSIPGLRYFVDRSFDLTTWTHILTIYSREGAIYFPVAGVDLLSAHASALTFTDTAITGQPETFYRLRIELD
jgi:hypothetical protein